MTEAQTRTELLIMGMRDNSCRERVHRVLGRVKGVKEVNVSLLRARVVVMHEPPCEPADLVWAVVRAGFGAALAPAGGAGRHR